MIIVLSTEKATIFWNVLSSMAYVYGCWHSAPLIARFYQFCPFCFGYLTKYYFITSEFYASETPRLITTDREKLSLNLYKTNSIKYWRMPFVRFTWLCNKSAISLKRNRWSKSRVFTNFKNYLCYSKKKLWKLPSFNSGSIAALRTIFKTKCNSWTLYRSSSINTKTRIGTKDGSFNPVEATFPYYNWTVKENIEGVVAIGD